MKNILFCNLSIVPNKLNLPYNWACLKTYCEKNKEILNNYHWLSPVIMGNGISELLKIDLKAIDVLGLSCYTWNHDKNYILATIVKSINPNCIVVAGGPEPDYNNVNYFKKYPLIDIVVKNEGEQAFHNLLLNTFNGLELIPGLIIPKGYDKIPFDTGDTIKINDFEMSPYMAQIDYFNSIIKEFIIDKNDLFSDINVVWETSRGCPYKCAYCKWDFTDSKSGMRKIPMKRLQREIEWFNSIDKNFFLHVLDSNFGLFKRDLDITKYICDNLNNPKMSFLHAAIDKSAVYDNEIVDLLVDNKFIRSKNIGIQHTDSLVLKNMKRYPVDINKVVNHNTPNMAHVILGGPGDNFNKWSKCLTDLIDVGIQEFIIYKYHIFANSHASTKEFIETNQVETITRYFQNYTREKTIYKDHNPNTQLIVSTNTYNKVDYVDMSLYGAMINAFHTGGLLKLVFKYFVDEEHYDYHSLYASLFNFLYDSDGFMNKIFQKCKSQMTDFVNNSYSLEELEIEEVPNSKYLYKIEEYMLFKFLYNFDKVWIELYEWFDKYINKSSITEDLFRYQMNNSILINYDYTKGKEFSTEYNWSEYFKGNGLKKKQTKYYIDDKRCGYGILMNWNKLNGEQRIQSYINTVIGTFYKRYKRSIFKNILEQKIKRRK